MHLAISPYEPCNDVVPSPKSILGIHGPKTETRLHHDQRPQEHFGSAARSALPAEGGRGQHFTMYPLMFQSPFVANVPYILDSLAPGSSQVPASPMSTLAATYPVLGSLYHAPPSPALTVQKNFSPSRAAAGIFRSDGRRQNATRITRSPYNNLTNHHNYVDINRIRDGIDVRTTVCLNCWFKELELMDKDYASQYSQ